MDWIRRNWPDLLIGIALIGVIAGIVATLLSGGSFLPTRQVETTPSPTTSTTQVAPVAPESDGTIADTMTGTDTDVPTVSVPGDTSASSDDLPGSTDNGDIIAVRPEGDEVQSDTTGTAATSDTAQAATATDTATGSEAADASPAEDSAQAITALSPPSNDGAYRISVGAFSSQGNANEHAATFENAGYPVFLGQQDDLFIVLVGPYNTQSEADQVAERIRASGLEPEPTIYQFSEDDVPASSDIGATDAAAGDVPAAGQDAAAEVASGDFQGRYIQVGAYASVESSLPQRELLESLGFQVYNFEESNLIKLLIGPFSGDELSAAQGRLNAQGISNFVR